jgi:hypothetical protein
MGRISEAWPALAPPDACSWFFRLPFPRLAFRAWPACGVVRALTARASRILSAAGAYQAP